MSDLPTRSVVTEFTPEVAACPEHVWRLEDHTPPDVTPTTDFYIMDVCQRCRAARCETGPFEANRCLEARHHPGPHRYPDGTTREIGETPDA